MIDRMLLIFPGILLALVVAGMLFGFQWLHDQSNRNHITGIKNHAALCRIEMKFEIPDGSC